MNKEAENAVNKYNEIKDSLDTKERKKEYVWPELNLPSNTCPELPELDASPDYDFGFRYRDQKDIWLFKVSNRKEKGLLKWTVKTDAKWITLHPISGIGNGSILVQIDTKDLDGYNREKVTVESNGGNKEGFIKVTVGEPPV
jgi:hypothetical protein